MFGIQKPHFLGIDFGTSYIKAVELTLNKGRPFLVNYGHIELRFTEGKNALFPTQSPEDAIHNHLNTLLQHLKPISKTVNLALPGFSGLITLLELPQMEDQELEKAIQFEAHKYIPSPLEDVFFSWEAISQKQEKLDDSSPKKTMEVLLVAALRKEVAKYERYMAGSNLPVDLLELEVFPLVRSVIGDRVGASLIVDIGSRATNLVLVKDGNVRLNRSLNAGGNEITSALSESFSISWERAEELKCGSKDFFNAPESKLIFSTVELITNEVMRLFHVYSAKDSSTSDSINEIILSGGTARMKGLAEHFSKLFQVPTSVANPWQRVYGDEMIRPALERLGPSFAIAVGLALGGIERYQKK